MPKIQNSAKDSELVRKIVRHFNDNKMTCYCDWMSDNDFLKRNLASIYTKEVLKRRIEQSEKVLLVKTSNSMPDGYISSKWIQLEIDYSKKIGKKIYIMDCSIENINFEYYEYIEEV